MNILITGHSAGIGNSLLNIFKSKNFNIFGISRNFSEQIELSHQLNLDLSKIENIKEASIWASKKKLDIFFHCAGSNPIRSILDSSSETYLNCFNLHFLSASQISRSCISNKNKNDFLKILFLSSIWSVISAHSRGPYSVAKSSLNCLAKQIAVEHGLENVQAVSLALGFVKTGLTELTKEDSKIQNAKERYLFSKNKLVNPDEVAKLISQIALQDLSLMNGNTLMLDGGITCQ